MARLDFSGASIDDLKVPEFRSEGEKKQFMEAMFHGEVPVPLILQGMGVDFTNETYAAEGARLGYIPTLSSAAPGWRVLDEDMSGLTFGQRRDKFLDENDRAAQAQVDYVKNRHPLSILAGNAMKKLTGYPSSADVYGKSGKVDILAAGAGILDKDDLQQIKGYPGMEVMPIVSSPIAARWILRVAKQVQMKIRMILVELADKAGGHLGAANAVEAENPKNSDPVAILKEIRKFAPDTPVVLAGGMAYRDQLLNALKMGYQGVGVATRGLLTHESGLSDALIKDVYLNPDYKIVTNDKSPTGYPGRYLEGPEHVQTPEERIAYVQHAVQNCVSCINRGECEFLLEANNSKDTHYCIAHDLTRTRRGEPGGIAFTGKIRDTIMHDPIYRDADRKPRVPSLEEALNYMLTHDAPPEEAGQSR